MSSSNTTTSTRVSAERYVVVTTTYPTTYGCNRGANWSKADMIVRSDRDATGSFKTREEAIERARRIRNRSDYFTDACEPSDQEDCSDEDDEYVPDGGYVFTNTDEPPYDSSDLENWDNDEEEIIEVMTQGEFDKIKAEDATYLRKENMKRRYEFTVQNKMMEVQIQDAGRVHYSTPPQPFDMKAELEVVEEDARDDPLAKLVDAKDIARGTGIPANASEIKSLMYVGGKKELGEFSKKCQRADSTTEDLGSSPLLSILAACTSLEEFHLKGGLTVTISLNFVGQLVKVAPHLQRTLKVLSLGLMEVQPDALQALSFFKAIERLDLQRSFLSFDGNCYEPSYDSDDYYGSGVNSVARDLPYDKGLVELVNSLPKLTRLDLGFGDDNQYLFEYMLSPHIVSAVRRSMKDKNGRLTMDGKNMPQPWSSREREEAAHYHALVSIMEDATEDEFIRQMANDEVKTCHVCKKLAGKRCTGCKRQYYCSKECQKKDHKKGHKKICVQRF